MKITFDSTKAYSAALIFLLGIGIFMGLPMFEKTVSFVKLGTVTMAAAPADATTEFGTPAMINVPVTWSAPFIGSCYLTVDARPQGAPKGEPETPAWDTNHLIRAKYDQKWWVQKWINVFVLQERSGSQELRFAIINPNATLIDVYTELKCDDQVLGQDQATITYKV